MNFSHLNLFREKEITNEFLSACKTLDRGVLVHDSEFSLYEAMTAIEIMEPKMDIGVLLATKSHNASKLVKHFSEEDFIWFFDHVFVMLQLWLDGNNSDQTLLIIHYLRNPLECESQMKTICLTVLKICSIIREIIQTANIYCAEEFFEYSNDLALHSIIYLPHLIDQLTLICENYTKTKNGFISKPQSNTKSKDVLYRLEFLRKMAYFFSFFEKDTITLENIDEMIRVLTSIQQIYMDGYFYSPHHSNSNVENITNMNGFVDEHKPDDNRNQDLLLKSSCDYIICQELLDKFGFDPLINIHKLPCSFPKKINLIPPHMAFRQFYSQTIVYVMYGLKCLHQNIKLKQSPEYDEANSNNIPFAMNFTFYDDLNHPVTDIYDKLNDPLTSTNMLYLDSDTMNPSLLTRSILYNILYRTTLLNHQWVDRFRHFLNIGLNQGNNEIQDIELSLNDLSLNINEKEIDNTNSLYDSMLQSCPTPHLFMGVISQEKCIETIFNTIPFIELHHPMLKLKLYQQSLLNIFPFQLKFTKSEYIQKLSHAIHVKIVLLGFYTHLYSFQELPYIYWYLEEIYGLKGPSNESLSALDDVCISLFQTYKNLISKLLIDALVKGPSTPFHNDQLSFAKRMHLLSPITSEQFWLSKYETYKRNINVGTQNEYYAKLSQSFKFIGHKLQKVVSTLKSTNDLKNETFHTSSNFTLFSFSIHELQNLTRICQYNAISLQVLHEYTESSKTNDKLLTEFNLVNDKSHKMEQKHKRIKIMFEPMQNQNCEKEDLSSIDKRLGNSVFLYFPTLHIYSLCNK